jgi:hypothetical protein
LDVLLPASGALPQADIPGTDHQYVGIALARRYHEKFPDALIAFYTVASETVVDRHFCNAHLYIDKKNTDAEAAYQQLTRSLSRRYHG